MHNHILVCHSCIVSLSTLLLGYTDMHTLQCEIVSKSISQQKVTANSISSIVECHGLQSVHNFRVIDFILNACRLHENILKLKWPFIDIKSLVGQLAITNGNNRSTFPSTLSLIYGQKTLYVQKWTNTKHKFGSES